MGHTRLRQLIFFIPGTRYLICIPTLFYSTVAARVISHSTFSLFTLRSARYAFFFFFLHFVCADGYEPRALQCRRSVRTSVQGGVVRDPT